MSPEPHDSVEVFYSYAHEDEKLRDELKKHLSNLKRQGVITDWYDRDITAGSEWDDEIKQHLESARVILLLISPDFMDSDYIHEVEVKRAMERHASGEARVIPVILRPVDWQGAPFSKLQALPTDAKPVRSWDDPDEAFLDITKGIRKAILDLSGPSAVVPAVPDIPRPPKVGFVSRRDKDGRDIVERLREELAPEKNQLVALWGSGGVGKTTLAAEAIRSLVEIHGQRVVWVSADARPNFVFSTLLDDIAEQLGGPNLRMVTGRAKEDGVRALISERATLIVLDNLETIAPEEESLCKEFLAKRVHCPALITTRERISDALLIPIASMSPEEAEEFLNRLMTQSSDPQIYDVVDRARILKTAEYNPLIIQWIIGQIDLAQDPEEVLSDLSHGEGDAAHRVFDRSYNLPQLNDGGRAVLLALALFTPSAGRPTLAAVAGMDLGKKKDKQRFKKAQEMLASLWLIKKKDGGLRLAVDGLTRELTKARLASDNRAKVFVPRFISRFLRYAQSHARFKVEDFDALELERENLLTATEQAFNSGDGGSVLGLAYILASPPNTVLSIRGYWTEEIRIATLALTVARSSKRQQDIAACSLTMGIATYLRGEFDEARRLFRETLDLKKNLGDRSGVSACLHNLASLAFDLGELDEADQLYTESLEIARALGDSSRIAATLTQFGVLALAKGERDKARCLFDESLVIAKKLGDPRDVGASMYYLAMLMQDEGKLEEAKQLFFENLELNRSLGDQANIASSLHELATIELEKENLGTAENLLLEGLTIIRKLGYQHSYSECVETMGKLKLAQGQFGEARKFFNEALESSERLGTPFRISSVKQSLALLAEKEGNDTEANRLLTEALPMLVKLRSPRAEGVRRDLERIGNKTS